MGTHGALSVWIALACTAGTAHARSEHFFRSGLLACTWSTLALAGRTFGAGHKAPGGRRLSLARVSSLGRGVSQGGASDSMGAPSHSVQCVERFRSLHGTAGLAVSVAGSRRLRWSSAKHMLGPNIYLRLITGLVLPTLGDATPVTGPRPTLDLRRVYVTPFLEWAGRLPLGQASKREEARLSERLSAKAGPRPPRYGDSS